MARNIRLKPDSIGQDLSLMIAAGKVTGVSSVAQFGRNTDFSIGVEETLWAPGGLFVPLTTAQTLSIVSTVAADNPAGTGAHSVRVWGLRTWDSAEVSEKLDLDGVTPVVTSNTFVMVNRIKVTDAGSGKTNAGVITVTGSSDATVQSQIRAGRAQSENGVYGVPDNKVAFITDIIASITSNNASTMELDLYVWEHADRSNSIRSDKATLVVSSNGANTAVRNFAPYLRIEGPVIFELAATATANNSAGTGAFDLILTDSPLPF